MDYILDVKTLCEPKYAIDFVINCNRFDFLVGLRKIRSGEVIHFYYKLTQLIKYVQKNKQYLIYKKSTI